MKSFLLLFFLSPFYFHCLLFVWGDFLVDSGLLVLVQNVSLVVFFLFFYFHCLLFYMFWWTVGFWRQSFTEKAGIQNQPAIDFSSRNFEANAADSDAWP